VTSPKQEDVGRRVRRVTNPSFAFENGVPIYNTNLAITTSGFEADIFESGLRRGPR